MANEEIQNVLRTGIQAAQSGNKAVARRIFEQVVEQDPDNEVAWLWMTSVVDTVDERRECLEKVLAINPDNERAQQALAKLEQAAPPSAPDRPSPPPPFEAPGAEPRRPVTPAPVSEAPKSPVPDLEERESLLVDSDTPPRRRQGLPRALFVLVALIAIGMIAAGIGLIALEELSTGEEESSATPPTVTASAATQPAQAGLAATATLASLRGSPTPLGGTLSTISSFESLPPTWTPTATWTPGAGPAATPAASLLGSDTVIVSAKRDGAERWWLYTMQANGSEEERLSFDIPLPGAGSPGAVDDEQETDNSGPSVAEIFGASYSPDATDIVFTVRIDSGQLYENSDIPIEYDELYIAPASGGEAERITALEALHSQDARWSPDGTRIVFASVANINDDYELFMLYLEDSVLVQLTDNDFDDRYPSWSPDGRSIAFASEQDSPDFFEIWRMRVDGSDLTQLTNDANNSYAPAWSPDGKLIAFVSDRRIDTDLYVMNADGTGERLLTVSDDEYEDGEATWSPDSQWIMFASRRDSLVYELYAIRPDGTDMRRLTEERGDNRYPVWQPS